MAPLTVEVQPVDIEELQKGKARHLAINLVTKYLRSVVKSDKLANKYNKELSSPVVKLDESNKIKSEDITLKDVLEKHLSALGNENGSSSDTSLLSVLVYKHILESTSEKVAKKFAKKANFCYDDVCNKLAKKQQKLSLDRACRKFLKKCEDSNSEADTDSPYSNKRKITSTGDAENTSPNAKRKKKDDSPVDDKKETLKEEENVPKAPKNNKPCFKCNQPGHFAKDCTNEITCYNCSKVGHTSKDCPKGANGECSSSSSKNVNITCYNCNEIGHNKRNCPELAGEEKKKTFDMECYHCKETGHLSRDCTKDGGVSCYNCGATGHLSRNCPESKEMLCYNCKKPGHVSKDCKVENGETSKMLCFKCNKMGHMARSCPNVADDTRRQNSYGNNNRGGGGNNNRGGSRGGRGNFNRKFTSAANSIPLGQRKSAAQKEMGRFD